MRDKYMLTVTDGRGCSVSCDSIRQAIPFITEYLHVVCRGYKSKEDKMISIHDAISKIVVIDTNGIKYSINSQLDMRKVG